MRHIALYPQKSVLVHRFVREALPNVHVILLLTHNILRKEISKAILNMFQMLFDPYAELCFSFSSSLLPQLSSKQFFRC